MFTTGEGTTSAATTFTVTNVGTAATGSIVVGMGSHAAEFPITNNTCSTLTAGATCTFDVAFSPASAASDYMDVEVRASNGVYFADTARAAVSLVDSISASNPALVMSSADVSATTSDHQWLGTCGSYGCPAGTRFWFGRTHQRRQLSEPPVRHHQRRRPAHGDSQSRR